MDAILRALIRTGLQSDLTTLNRETSAEKRTQITSAIKQEKVEEVANVHFAEIGILNCSEVRSRLHIP
jgi:hypothetical protein